MFNYSVVREDECAEAFDEVGLAGYDTTKFLENIKQLNPVLVNDQITGKVFLIFN